MATLSRRRGTCEPITPEGTPNIEPRLDIRITDPAPIVRGVDGERGVGEFVVAPYHDWQVAVLDRTQWADWLDPSVPARSVLKPLPAGSLQVEQVDQWTRNSA